MINERGSSTRTEQKTEDTTSFENEEEEFYASCNTYCSPFTENPRNTHHQNLTRVQPWTMDMKMVDFSAYSVTIHIQFLVSAQQITLEWN